jgi:hypothetical protein
MPIPDNLQALAEQIGFGRAFLKLSTTLPRDIWQELSFEQCVDICFVTHSDRLRLLATKRMKEIGTFHNWRNEFYAPLRNNTKLIVMAISHMARLAAQSGKTNWTLRVMRDAFSMCRLFKDFKGIGRAAQNHLPPYHPARSR